MRDYQLAGHPAKRRTRRVAARERPRQHGVAQNRGIGAPGPIAHREQRRCTYSAGMERAVIMAGMVQQPRTVA